MYTMTQNNVLLNTNPDPTLKDFFQRKDRFADLMNCLLFHGLPILHDHILVPYDSNSSTVFHQKALVTSINKDRDIMMKAIHDDASLLIGLENQQTLDYTMPFRILVYDTITYNQQFNQLNKTAKKSFRPLPVMTCVLYYGDKKWKQPHSFKERMTIPDIYEGMINDWNGHIYDIKDIDVNKLNHPDNYMMIKAVQRFYNWDKKIESLRDMTLTKEVAVVVATIIGNKKFGIRIQKEESEEINMCTVFDEYVNEKVESGRMEGKISLLVTLLKRKFGIVSEDLIMRIESSTSDEVEKLTIHILDAKSEEDIMNIFNEI